MKLTISKYAALCNVDRRTIHARAKAGLIELIREVQPDGKLLCFVDTEKYPPVGKQKPGRKKLSIWFP